jgi:hypothetical protein
MSPPNGILERRVRFARSQSSLSSQEEPANNQPLLSLLKAEKDSLHPISSLQETDDSAAARGSSARPYRLRSCSRNHPKRLGDTLSSSQTNNDTGADVSDVNSSPRSHMRMQTSDVPDNYASPLLSPAGSQLPSDDEGNEDADDNNEDNDSDYHDHEDNQNNDYSNIPPSPLDSATLDDVEVVVYRDAQPIQRIRNPKSFSLQCDRLRQTIILRWMRFYSYYPRPPTRIDKSRKDLLRKRVKMPARYDSLRKCLNNFLSRKFNQLSLMGLLSWDGNKNCFRYHPSTDVWLEESWDGFENSPCKPSRSNIAPLSSTKTCLKRPAPITPLLDGKRRRVVALTVASSEERPTTSRAILVKEEDMGNIASLSGQLKSWGLFIVFIVDVLTILQPHTNQSPQHVRHVMTCQIIKIRWRALMLRLPQQTASQQKHNYHQRASPDNLLESLTC